MAYFSIMQFTPNDATRKNIPPSAHQFTIYQMKRIQILENYNENFVWKLTQIGLFVLLCIEVTHGNAVEPSAKDTDQHSFLAVAQICFVYVRRMIPFYLSFDERV
jgi:hypothetical protein